MKHFIEEYGKVLMNAIITLFFLSAFFQLFDHPLMTAIFPKIASTIPISDNSELTDLPTLIVQENIVLPFDTEFNKEDYILEAKSSEGDDLKDAVKVYFDNSFSTVFEGLYEVKFVLNYNGMTVVRKTHVLVKKLEVSES